MKITKSFLIDAIVGRGFHSYLDTIHWYTRDLARLNRDLMSGSWVRVNLKQLSIKDLLEIYNRPRH